MAGSSAARASWSSSYWRSASSGRPTSSQSRVEELRLERADREVAPVRRRVDAVAGEAAGEDARHRLAAEAVRDEVVRAVRHRDDDPRALAGARPLEERREDLRDRAERAGGEVGDLHRRQLGRGVLEHARPAEVVEVVARAPP